MGFWVTPLHWKHRVLQVVCPSDSREDLSQQPRLDSGGRSCDPRWLWHTCQRSTSLLHHNVLQIFNTRTQEQKETVSIFHIWSAGDTNLETVLIVEIFGAAGLNTCVTLFCQNQRDSPNMNASRNFDCKRRGHKQRSLTKWSQISFVSWVSSGGTFCSVPPEQGTNMSRPASLPLVQLSSVQFIIPDGTLGCKITNTQVQTKQHRHVSCALNTHSQTTELLLSYMCRLNRVIAQRAKEFLLLLHLNLAENLQVKDSRSSDVSRTPSPSQYGSAFIETWDHIQLMTCKNKGIIFLRTDIKVRSGWRTEQGGTGPQDETDLQVIVDAPCDEALIVCTLL